MGFNGSHELLQDSRLRDRTTTQNYKKEVLRRRFSEGRRFQKRSQKLSRSGFYQARKAHKHKFLGPVALGTTPGLSQRLEGTKSSQKVS